MKSNYSIVRREVKKAYGEKGRMIFRASMGLNPLDVFTIMTEVVPKYNNFDAHCLLRLPIGCSVTIAREYSVCLYVSVPRHAEITRAMAKKMLVSEFTITLGGEARLWWD